MLHFLKGIQLLARSLLAHGRFLLAATSHWGPSSLLPGLVTRMGLLAVRVPLLQCSHSTRWAGCHLERRWRQAYNWFRALIQGCQKPGKGGPCAKGLSSCRSSAQTGIWDACNPTKPRWSGEKEGVSPKNAAEGAHAPQEKSDGTSGHEVIEPTAPGSRVGRGVNRRVAPPDRKTPCSAEGQGWVKVTGRGKGNWVEKWNSGSPSTPKPNASNVSEKRWPRKYLVLFVHDGPNKDTLRRVDALDQSGGTVPTNSNRIPGRLVVGARTCFAPLWHLFCMVRGQR
jgi:hypothetical protein